MTLRGLELLRPGNAFLEVLESCSSCGPRAVAFQFKRTIWKCPLSGAERTASGRVQADRRRASADLCSHSQGRRASSGGAPEAAPLSESSPGAGGFRFSQPSSSGGLSSNPADPLSELNSDTALSESDAETALSESRSQRAGTAPSPSGQSVQASSSGHSQAVGSDEPQSASTKSGRPIPNCHSIRLTRNTR